MSYSNIEDYEKDRKELIDILKFTEVFNKLFNIDKMPDHIKESRLVCDKILNILEQSNWSNNTFSGAVPSDLSAIFDNTEKQLRKFNEDTFILFAGKDDGKQIITPETRIRTSLESFIAIMSTIIIEFAEKRNLKAPLLLALIDADLYKRERN